MPRTRLLLAALFALLTLPVLAQVQVTSQNNLQVEPPALRQAEPPAMTASAEDLERQGDELRAHKAYLDALDYYQAALAKTSPKASIYNKMGIIQMNLQHYSEARKSFEKAIKTDRKQPEALNNLGVIHYLNKNYGSAIKQYRKAIALDGDSASFYANLGAAYFEQKDFSKAAQAYAKALELDPELLERTSHYGVAAHLRSPTDQAHYYYVIAKMYAKMGDFDRALLCLRRSLEDGYKDFNQVYKDSEFSSLRKTAGFNALMAARPVSLQQE